MAIPALFPLAQLVDLLPQSGWNALLAGGMLTPIVGLLVSFGIKNSSRWKWTAVGIFYLISLPLAGLIFLAQTENRISVCSFLLLLPLGMLLGLVVLVVPRRGTEPRGFEIRPESDDEAG